MITISYCVTVCNEINELIRLTNFILPYIKLGDELLIQYDTDSVTDDVKNYLDSLKTSEPEKVTVVSHPLNNNFAQFKNNLKNNARGVYILQLDADELISNSFMGDLHDIIEENNGVDLFFMPRLNTVDGITESHINKWGWKITKNTDITGESKIDIDSDEYKYLQKMKYIIDEDEYTSIVKYYKPIINFPDYQTRLYRNSDEIKWDGNVHETIIGYKTFAIFPGIDDYCIIHDKTIARQEKQNNYYEQI